MWRTHSSFDTIPELRSRTAHKMGDKQKHSPGVHGRRRRHPNQQCIFGSDVGLGFWFFFVFLVGVFFWNKKTAY